MKLFTGPTEEQQKTHETYARLLQNPDFEQYAREFEAYRRASGEFNAAVEDLNVQMVAFVEALRDAFGKTWYARAFWRLAAFLVGLRAPRTW